MKYTYFYQTKDNENRSGEIKARDRADAYTQLRKRGIRPYRVAGDDPPKWRRWLPVASVAALLAVVAVVAAVEAVRFLGSGSADAPIPRQQLVGAADYIAAGVASDWAEVLPTELDRYLAAFAQPGWEVVRPVPAESVLEGLKRPLALADADRAELRQLKRILLQMRAELSGLVASGGTLADYAAILVERQASEVALRAKAVDSLLATPRSLRRRAHASLNLRLRDRNIAPIPASLLGDDDF